ncbi:lactate dehydrogenase [Alteriqipengyuania sp. NZ-12B]|uniref:site-specific DNA-methyltransferase (adenine-specific) n=1 Tax=Alteriqipengyuania abyssalis TaxID=2860200 RepID=A0ABS7PH64_9SPHN|nr:DNA methyltransferase [Alteriqipengyuania abyssalis]MBY8338404.1 lactate dehydrogenase [Alteriqipengyuania abyssalis]
MNPVEIEEAVSTLASEPFDPVEFPFQFLAAFGNKATTINRLRKGNTNQSDLGGVLQRSNIHIATSDPGDVANTLTALRESPKTASNKAKFILATDGEEFQAEDLTSGETVACDYADFPNHFGFFLPLAGITTVEQIRESSFDIRATGRLNKLYVTLLQENPDWATAERRADMNHFMARLIFCFFAEDTGVFHASHPFTRTVERMSAGGDGNTHEVIRELFRAMNTRIRDDDGKLTNRFRDEAGIPNWANNLPYVNGHLFGGEIEVPSFSKIARSYLIHIGNLDWTKINPDIFGSMIQAVADDEERGALGMHYTSVPNILKVLNPLFLDDLRATLEEAGDNGRKLLNLRARMARIRVFDPACGSGNFLVIAYKQMREIEAEINARREEADRKSDIPLTNFRGIELRDFPAEIARLALIIAEYQCDVRFRGQKEALAEFLPLDSDNWITCGNALRLDWLSICPPTGTSVKMKGDDLFGTPLDQSEIDFENVGGETYICGNPPYLGSTWQSATQKSELQDIFGHRTSNWKSLDYVAGWFMKAADYGTETRAASAFVATNSICQGQQVPILWPVIAQTEHEIIFAHTSFKWANLASYNAGVTVVIVGIGPRTTRGRKIFSTDEYGQVVVQEVDNINPYLAPGPTVIIQKSARPLNGLAEMTFGSKPVDGGNLLLTRDEVAALKLSRDEKLKFVRPIYGSDELISGKAKFCLWIEDADREYAKKHVTIGQRLEGVRRMRLESTKAATQRGAGWPHRFDERRQLGTERVIAVGAISSENREYLPSALLPSGTIISNKCYAVFDAPLWNQAILLSRLHWVWIGAVCVRLEMRFSYSNTLGWNTFPLPKLTEQNKADLTRCAENILLAREAHFPATIADLYDPEAMPKDLRRAHEENDEVLERIYIGRRFRNDTERLEKLFELYTKMTAKGKAA